MRREIVELLCDAEGYLSGEAISKEMGITRAAVWKHIKTLKEDGCVIEAHTNKGYRLVSLPDMLKPEYIGLFLKKMGPKLVWLESVGSTNDYAKQLARAGEREAVVIAEHQTGGKGRLGRVWDSRPGEAVQMSFLLRPDIVPQCAPAFNLAAALAVCRVLERECGVMAKIKWPNDVVYENRKLCGILTEMSADMDQVEYLVCGIGVNANQSDFPAELKERAVSVFCITGHKVDRVRLAAALIGEVVEVFSLLEAEGFQAIAAEFAGRSAIIGKEIVVNCGKDSIGGICAGFGENGELLLENNGKKRVFHAGEVSVRGIHGYV